MPRRHRHKEVIMPEWVRGESKQREQILERKLVPVAVPIRPEEAKHQAYRYADIPNDDRPWYLRNESDSQVVEESTWYGTLLQRLAGHITEQLFYLGEEADVEQIINNWLCSNHEFNRAILIGLICEESVRSVLLDVKTNPAVVDSAVRMIFS